MLLDACVDTNNGETDSNGKDCAAYDLSPTGCGFYDTNEFIAGSMCCVCKYRTIGNSLKDIEN